MIERKFIGGREVSPIGIGTWLVSCGRYNDGLSYADYTQDEMAVKAIRLALTKGANHIDTATYYGAGHTEEVIGRAIKGFPRESLFIASKLWRTHIRKDSIPRAIEDILKRMDTEYLDLIYLHRYFTDEPLSIQFTGLSKAVSLGLVRDIGVANYSLEQLREAQKVSDLPISALQNIYNILQQEEVSPEFLEYCNTQNITVVATRPFQRGSLADNCQDERVLNLAKTYNKSPSQIALNWLICQNGVVTIPKATTLKHIKENLEARDFEIEASDLMSLFSKNDKK